MVREFWFKKAHPGSRSGMPFTYFCDCCGEEISQHKGVTMWHEKACFKRRARGYRISFRIRKEYFDRIVSGEKTDELRARIFGKGRRTAPARCWTWAAP